MQCPLGQRYRSSHPIRIRQSLEEADNARAEARELLEEHRKLIAQAKGEAEEILAETRRVADANQQRM